MAGRGSAKAGGDPKGLQGSLFDPEPAGAATPAAQRHRKLVLVDGHALAYRSYHAIRELSTSSGVTTNAVYGFARAILDLIDDAATDDAIVVAFDTPKPTFRHERFEEYKAGRAPTPADFPSQLALIKRLIALLGVSYIEAPGYEADDIIGTLARRAVESTDDLDVEILTSDRDALQLVSERVSVIQPDAPQPIGPAEVRAKYGVAPEQWIDYRALTGDTSDNIPGVRGVGPVAARGLLNRYGSVAGLLSSLSEVEPRSQAKLIEESLADLELSLELSRIDTDAPVNLDLGAWRLAEAKADELTELLQELEFGSLLHRLGLGRRVEYRAVALDQVAELEGVAVGYALDGGRPTTARLTGVALAGAGEVAAPSTAADGIAALAEVAARGPLNAVDAKVLTVVARLAGVADAVPGDDPLLMAYMIDSTGAGAEALTRRLGAGEWGADAASRAVATAELARILQPRLGGETRALYEQVERPLQAVLADMELAGIKVDPRLLATLSHDLGAELARLEDRVRELSGEPHFNVLSRDQVAWLLYEKLGLRSGKRTSTGKLSTAVGSLEPLRGTHEAVDVILEHREVAKLKGTYVDPLLELMDPATGRLHTTYHQASVATGRLASSDPNLQSIPIRSERGREIRKAFIADEGMALVVADYSQIELRVLAHVADEPALIEAFTRGDDIHRATAAKVFSVHPAGVTADMRRAAKIINFGVLYGMSANRLSNELSVPYAEAAQFIDTYFLRYPKVRAYIDETLASGRELGYVRTLLGRRRAVPRLRSPQREVREAAEREAYNMPIQGGAADIMKLAMLRLSPALAALGGRLLLQVHDEVIAEVPIEAVDRAVEVVRDALEGAYQLRVPLTAEVGVGANWLDAK